MPSRAVYASIADVPAPAATLVTRLYGERRAWDAQHPERLAVHRKRGKVRQRFGITLEEYEARTENAVCEVCSGRDAKTGLDHDHESGEIRGVLCGRCNTALGLLKDDPQRIRALALYLERKRTVM